MYDACTRSPTQGFDSSSIFVIFRSLLLNHNDMVIKIKLVFYPIPMITHWPTEIKPRRTGPLFYSVDHTNTDYIIHVVDLT